MRILRLAICIALAAATLAPVASACCIHTTRTIAWAEYANVGGETLCAVVSAPTPLQQEGCALAVEGGQTFQLAAVDGAAANVGISWDACGLAGSGDGLALVVVPLDCETVNVALGPTATAGVLRIVL